VESLIEPKLNKVKWYAESMTTTAVKTNSKNAMVNVNVILVQNGIMLRKNVIIVIGL